MRLSTSLLTERMSGGVAMSPKISNWFIFCKTVREEDKEDITLEDIPQHRLSEQEQ